MNLEQYFCKKVRLIDINGKSFQGLVDGFSYAKDDERNEDAIDLDCGYGFYESDIVSIEIIEDE